MGCAVEPLPEAEDAVPPSVAPMPEAVPAVVQDGPSDAEIIEDVREQLEASGLGVIQCIGGIVEPISVELNVTVQTSGEWVQPEITVIRGVVTEGELVCMEDVFFGVRTQPIPHEQPVRKTYRFRRAEEDSAPRLGE